MNVATYSHEMNLTPDNYRIRLEIDKLALVWRKRRFDLREILSILLLIIWL